MPFPPTSNIPARRPANDGKGNIRGPKKHLSEEEIMDQFRRVGIRAFLDPIFMRLFDPIDIPHIPPVIKKKPKYGPIDVTSCLKYVAEGGYYGRDGVGPKPDDENMDNGRGKNGDLFGDDERELEERYKRGNPKAGRMRSNVIPPIRGSSDQRLTSLIQSVAPPLPRGPIENGVFLYGLPYECTPADIAKSLTDYREIKSVRLIYNIRTLAPKGYAFVYFARKGDDLPPLAQIIDAKLEIHGKNFKADWIRGNSLDFTPRRLGGTLGGWTIKPKEKAKPRRRHRTRGLQRASEKKVKGPLTKPERMPPRRGRGGRQGNFFNKRSPEFSPRSRGAFRRR